MDLKLSTAPQAPQLALPWDFAGKNGHKLTPQTAPQVAQWLQWCEAQDKPVAFSETEAALLPEPLWLDLSALNQVRQHPVADFIIQVECGMTYRELLAVVAPHQQTWPLSYPPNMSIGQILAEERPALETGLRGYPRDYVLKTELATPNGQITVSGADVVKNVTGYDLAKLHIGGHHAFGVLTSVTLKLTALPQARRQWLYELESLNSAYSFLTRLMDSKLPLNVCELFQQKWQWFLLIEVTGDDLIIAQYEEVLAQLGGPKPSVLDTRSGQALIFELQNQLEAQTLIEVSFPLNQWQGFVTQISKQSSLGELRLQVRPAAGLVYIHATRLPFAALRYLKEQAQPFEGVLQILRIAKSDVTATSEATAIFAEFNIPPQPVLRHLLRDLKKSYDPKGILFTPRLPLAQALS
ncbi:FAD-binding oxidoreductase [Vampirovibrio sp.]|uniref:FAD-binding oxidoreductase n=1 Tax=Vampirovibrio sp. TaxID=2717857 RepID=UPI00359354AB